MRAAGLSQSELARRVGVSQPTIYKLLRRSKKGSTHLHRIARELGTTPAYLEGEIDDPLEGAIPPPAPPPARIMLEVTLPSEDLLSSMFEGILLGLDPDLPLAERARLLAQSLPIAMSRLQGARPAPGPSALTSLEDASFPSRDFAMHGPGERQ